MPNLRKLSLLVGIAIAATGSIRAADGSAKPAKPDMATNLSTADLQKLVQQFNQRRDTLLADRQQLVDQLKNATAEQRKQILAKMEAQQKELLDAQRALGKQIRDDMKKLRQTTPGGGR